MKKRWYILFLLFFMIVGSGFSAWYFDSANSKISDNLDANFDDIRDNYVLGETGDYSDNTQRYNVYFFAQSDFDPGRNAAGTAPDRYYYKLDESGVVTNKLVSGVLTMIDERTVSYGYFRSLGSSNLNNYYKVLTNVTEITSSHLKSIGVPQNKLLDGNFNGAYGVYFTGWSLHWDIGNYDLGNLEKEEVKYPGISNGRVRGNHPWGDKSLTMLPADVSLQNFLDTLDSSQYVAHNNTSDGTIDLYAFPIYSCGKDYLNYEINGEGEMIYNGKDCNDTIELVASGAQNKYFIHNDKLSDATNYILYNKPDTGSLTVDNDTKYVNVYEYPYLDLNGLTGLRFKIADTASSQSWMPWSYFYSKENYDFIEQRTPNNGYIDDNKVLVENIYSNFLSTANVKVGSDTSSIDRLLSSGKGKGVYKIYAFVKTGSYNPDTGVDNSIFTSDEIDNINNQMTTNPIIGAPYTSFVCYSIHQGKGGKYTTGTSAYIAMVKLYEPHIIGGPSEGMSYASTGDSEYQLLRDLDNTNLYYIDNIRFNVENDDDWFTYGNYKLSHIVFGILLEASGNGTTTFNLNVPGYHDSKGNEYNTEQYCLPLNNATNIDDDVAKGNNIASLANDSLIKNMFRINGDVGYGIYSLAIELQYTTTIINNGSEYEREVSTLSSVNLYLFREHNIYIVLYENDSNIPYDTNASGVFVRPDVNGNTGFNFVARKIYLDTYYQLDDPIFDKVGNNSFSTQIGPAQDISGKYTLGELIDYYDSLGYEIYDRVTGFVFTRESTQDPGFKIMQNYILQIRAKS